MTISMIQKTHHSDVTRTINNIKEYYVLCEGRLLVVEREDGMLLYFNMREIVDFSVEGDNKILDWRVR